MYVRKFEAETLDEALKAVKSELGPDAIILKTNSFKNLKGSLGRKKVEITAAITEEDYKKKAKIDSILKEEEKDDFYKRPSKQINQVMKGFSYGKLGLNKKANLKAEAEDGPSLSSFLDEGEEAVSSKGTSLDSFSVRVDEAENSALMEERNHFEHASLSADKFGNDELEKLINLQKEEINLLNEKIGGLTRDIEELKILNNPKSKVHELKQILKSFDLSDSIIDTVLRKARFELSTEELDNEELLYDLTLREIRELIRTKPAKFTEMTNRGKSTLTVFISEGASGQSSMTSKISSLVKDSSVVRYSTEKSEDDLKFSQKMLDLQIEDCSSFQDVVSRIKGNFELGKNVFLDLRACNHREDDTKRIVQSLKKSFDNVEILLCLSAIHSELYNRKVCNKFGDISDGIAVSHLDLCLNLSSLINLQHVIQKPYVFFGTGPIIPDDIEEASADRLITEIFNV